MDFMIDGSGDPEDAEIHKALIELLNERIQEENEEDLAAGEVREDATDYQNAIKDDEIEELMKIYMESTGQHLWEIEDEDEFEKAWVEWVKGQLPVKLVRKYKPNKLEAKHLDLMKSDPLYKHLADMV